jgi:hypothetical protein
MVWGGEVSGVFTSRQRVGMASRGVASLRAWVRLRELRCAVYGGAYMQYVYCLRACGSEVWGAMCAVV